MGPRIYPSQQNTNANATGSVIVTMDNTVNFISMAYNNRPITNVRVYKIKDGYYAYNLRLGERVTINYAGSFFSIKVIRKDYTTDDVNGNDGISYTNIATSNNVTTYSFTAATLPTSYNFDYLIQVSTTPF